MTDKKMNIYEKLAKIQSEVHVGKGQYNSFGKYSYRSAEDILEAVKPVCHANGCVLVVGDDIVNIEGRFYVKATAVLFDTESDKEIRVTAFAREEENKKGMDASQVTGACSSYARKYALNGLFNLDDSKDADTDAYTEAQNKAKKAEAEQKIMAQEQADKPVSAAEVKKLEKLLTEYQGVDSYAVRLEKIYKKYGVNSLSELKKSQYVHLCGGLTK